MLGGVVKSHRKKFRSNYVKNSATRKHYTDPRYSSKLKCRSTALETNCILFHILASDGNTVQLLLKELPYPGAY